MNQQVLARKWRPTTFDQLIGQDHVRKALIHALDSDRLHHAYLFSGTRGVGKTTIARILARCLNCEQGVTSKPCGDCGSCRSITANRFVDLIEVDAASRTKVDDTRELLENVSYAPSQGRYKVYLIDEVHMLTTHSFNALLKTLEEPPTHVIFLLATTDPQKILPTVLSRCLQLHLRNLSPDLIASHLENVLNQEDILFEKEALWHLAEAGRGSVRDAMTLLDQAIVHGEGQIQISNVIEMLGTQGLSEIPELLTNVAKGDANTALEHLSRIARETPDWMTLVSGLQSTLHQVAVTQISDASVNHLSPDEQKKIRELAELMTPEFVQLAYHFTLTGYRDLPLASDVRSAFEMLILRMIAFRPAQSGESLSNETPERKLHRALPVVFEEIETNNLKADDLRPKNEDNKHLLLCGEETEGSKQKDQQSEIQNKELSLVNNQSAMNELNKLIEPSPARVHSSKSEIFVGSEIVVKRPIDASEACKDAPKLSYGRMTIQPDDWETSFTLLKLKGMTESLIAQTVLLSVEPKKVVLATNAHTGSLLNDMHRRRIADAFAEFLGEVPEIIIETNDNFLNTPEEYRSRLKAERLSEAREQFDHDPFIMVIKERFCGSVRVDTVEPKDGEAYV